MRTWFYRLAAYLLLAVVAACGGGSGGEGNGGSDAVPANPQGAWLSFEPGSLESIQFEGESVPVSVTAYSSRTFEAPFNVAILDANGVITNQMEFFALSQTSYRAILHTNGNLGVGAHNTRLEVRVCEDDPLTCAKPFPGSPWRISLALHVKPKTEASSRVTLSVPSLSLIAYPDEALNFSVEAKFNGNLNSRVVNIGFYDPAKLTVTSPSQTITQSGEYVFNFSTVADSTLPIGTHQSDLQLRICEDAISVCKLPVSGSPWILPLTLAVKSSFNLKPLEPVAGLGAWTTYQGNPRHTGFVDAIFDPLFFSRRWRVKTENTYLQPYASTAIEDGRIFYTRYVGADRWELVALSEGSGQIDWKVDLGVLSYVGSPAATGGRVYLTSTGHADSFMWGFDQSNGKLLYKTPMSSQWGRYSAPTVFDSDVFSINGYYGGIGKFNGAYAGFVWNVGHPITSVSDGWSPSTDGRFVYSYSTPDNKLIALNASDGRLAFSVGAPYNFSTAFSAKPVILTDDQLGIVASEGLMAFDLVSQKRVWSLNAPSSGVPAVGNGMVYAFGANGTVLEARDPKTGNLLWVSENLGGEQYSSVVVTKNLAFVSSRSSTLAIDLATQKIVWRYPLGGNLAISSRGVLAILSNVGTLATINLR